ncbi:hypothetical protein M1523_03565 [Patescibacteria group bacterium]|nr:hypothetical protein [Patescibacteria group bacterium]MCL5092029.1 hypothetical protein [Patescibacteria group bacterium]
MAVFDEEMISNLFDFLDDLKIVFQTKWWWAVVAAVILGGLILLQQLFLSLAF